MILELFNGNCLDVLSMVPDNSIDSVVTDPPYGLKFMGKKWDYEVPSVDIWREVLRVLKPGGHVLSFCGTRTYHRMVVNMEDAGFEIRDQIQWIYGSGFPKSHDVSKAIDKAAGAEREKGPIDPARAGRLVNQSKDYETDAGWSAGNRKVTIDPPSTDAAKKWQGWGTALKPANEPICLARKPLEGTVAANVLKYGTGGINVDASRIDTNGEQLANSTSAPYAKGLTMNKSSTPGIVRGQPTGRWPANVIFDEEAASVLDKQSGACGGAGGKTKIQSPVGFSGSQSDGTKVVRNDSGGASRFFYVAKASKRERNAGLEGMPEKFNDFQRESSGLNQDRPGREGRKPMGPSANHHPTVKPIKLMQYLIRMVTPPGGVVLDPFMGSGSTGVAAKSLGFGFLGVELDKDYLKIAERRINSVKTKK